MPIVITSPATLIDMAELCDVRSRLTWAVVREMWAGGRTFAARDGQRTVALAGFYPIDGDPEKVEAWFNVTPAASRHMLGICRAMKLTIRTSGYREIVAIVSTDAGKRIARALGFRFFGASELGEVWQWVIS